MIKKVKINDMKIFDTDKLNEALILLNEQLELRQSPVTELVVCGGSALLASRLVMRTTQDVDVVALIRNGTLVNAEPLPDYLMTAILRVAQIMHLPDDWMNNGPASQFCMGLPPGFEKRLQRVCVGTRLIMYYIGRVDQIYFKTFASADRGGYHITDLKALNPSDEEIKAAVLWCMEQDVSEGFRYVMKEMLNHTGWKNVSACI